VSLSSDYDDACAHIEPAKDILRSARKIDKTQMTIMIIIAPAPPLLWKATLSKSTSIVGDHGKIFEGS
jgi:hypothetical protein